MTSTERYHHGDLRSSLLREAARLLADDGVDGLSLRRLAERTGVSRAAPYHHFKDKHSLLCALAAEGFQTLSTLIEAGFPKRDAPSLLRGFIRDYIDFAVSQPERYDLMFGRRLWKQGTPTAELKQVAYGTFRCYAQHVAALNHGTGEGRKSLRLAQASWATLHGLCHLMIDGIYVDETDMQEVSDVALSYLIRSIQTPNNT